MNAFNIDKWIGLLFLVYGLLDEVHRPHIPRYNIKEKPFEYLINTRTVLELYSF